MITFEIANDSCTLPRRARIASEYDVHCVAFLVAVWESVKGMPIPTLYSAECARNLSELGNACFFWYNASASSTEVPSPRLAGLPKSKYWLMSSFLHGSCRWVFSPLNSRENASFATLNLLFPSDACAFPVLVSHATRSVARWSSCSPHHLPTAFRNGRSHHHELSK